MAERAFTRALGATCAFAGRGLLRARGRRPADARADCSARTAARWSRTARCSTAATTRRPSELARDMLAKAPESIRRLFAAAMRRVLVLRPEPGASATVERARAAAGSTPLRCRCSRSSRSPGRRPIRAQFDGAAADQRQCGAARRRAARAACAGCRSMRSAKRPPRRRARPGSTSPATRRRRRRRGCSARSSRTCAAAPVRRGPRDAAATRSRRSPPFRSIARERSIADADLRGAGARRADPFAARRRSALPSWSIADRRASIAHRRDQRGRGRSRRRRLGKRSKLPSSRTTTRCWPSPRRLCNKPRPK